MSWGVDKIVSSYYCQIALRMCAIARELYEKGEYKNSSEICEFISSLCIKNDCDFCKKESSICGKASSLCKEKNSHKLASFLCQEARRACPSNDWVQGG
ncbi:MAG: hypothetical protein QXG01_06655 [Candidatus Bathyarchaeia archaeon]